MRGCASCELKTHLLVADRATSASGHFAGAACYGSEEGSHAGVSTHLEERLHAEADAKERSIGAHVRAQRFDEALQVR